jgi:hypothetical protein
VGRFIDIRILRYSEARDRGSQVLRYFTLRYSVVNILKYPTSKYGSVLRVSTMVEMMIKTIDTTAITCKIQLFKGQ